MAATGIRSSPAKSVDSKILPDFYPKFKAHIEPLYKKVDIFHESIGDENLPGGTIEELKDNIMNLAIDNYVKEVFSDMEGVQAITLLSQLCRETKKESENHIPKDNNQDITIEYDIYNSIVCIVSNHIRTYLHSVCAKHGKRLTIDYYGGEENAIALDIPSDRLKYIIAPDSIAEITVDGGFGMPKYDVFCENVANSDYPDEVKEYTLGQAKILLVE